MLRKPVNLDRRKSGLRGRNAQTVISIWITLLFLTLCYFPFLIKQGDSYNSHGDTSRGSKSQETVILFPPQGASRPQQYDRRAGTADMTGELFEVNVASLLFTRGLFETDGFYLATNVNHAGAFDDLLFKFKDKDTKIEHTCFLQLKTRLNSPISSQSLCSLTGGFSLLKYYSSYCDIQNQFSTRAENGVFRGSFENCEFIIYTNTKLESEDSWQEIPTNGYPENILFSGMENGKVLNLKCGSEEDRKAFAVLESYRKQLEEIFIISYNLDELKCKLKDFQLLNQCKQLLDAYKNEKCFKALLNKQLSRIADRTMWEQFLKKLKLYTCQAIEGELKDAVQQNLETYCGTSGLQTEDIFTRLNIGMIEWWRKGKYFLTQTYAPFWDIIMKKHISDLVESMSCKLAIVAELQFQDTEDISERGQVAHIITGGTTKLSCLKVQQNLKDVGHIMIDNITLQNHLREVLALWQMGLWYSVLVIEGGTDNQNIIMSVSDVLYTCPGKQLIIVTCDYDHMASMLSETFQCTTHKDNFKINQLDEASKEKIMKCKVDFQGFTVALNTIADNSALQNTLTADAVVELLMGHLKVGEELLYQNSYYISRTLLREELIDKEVLNIKGNACFAISGTTIQDLQLLLKSDFVITKFDNCRQVSFKECQHFVIDNINDFNALCSLYSNVHWLHKQGDSFVLKMSKGDTEINRNHLDVKIYSNLMEIMALPDKFVVIVADPGMGKSTELTHISSDVKQFDRSTWVVRVNLNNHTHYLSSDESNALQLLLMSGKFNSTFERCLFEYNVYHGRNVVVMFDGFDEISPNYSNKVLHMLRDLKTTRIEKLWITSRPIMRKKLEHELNTLSFTIKAFSQENQKEFLHKFWLIMSSSHDMNIFINRLLTLTQKSLSDRLSTFTGIPLQTRMLAEAFQAEAKHYSETGKIKLPLKLDLLQLYDKFVDRKWEIYYSEKNKVNITNVGVFDDYQELKELFQENYKNCAMVTLLLDQVRKLHDSELIIKKCNRFLKKFKEGHEKIGIVVNTINDRALFSHLTFAEYFAAIWFSENFKSNRNFLEETLFKSNFQTVRKFFNRILSRNFDLHCATLNQDIDSLLVLLSEHHVDVNMEDLGGRTALHLAVMNCIDSHDDNFSSVTYQIIEILLQHGANPDIKDAVLCWRPLNIADRTGAWGAVDLLLEYTSDISDLVFTTENINDDKFVQDILKVAAKQGFLHLLGYVLKCGVHVEHCVNRGTILHEVAKHGQLKLAQFLIAQHADIESQDSWNKRTPLMWAADAGQVQVVEYLVQHGGNVCTRDEVGNTALLRAALNGKLEVLKLLVQHNSDVKVCNNFGDNVLHCATVCGGNELMRYILDKLELNINSCNNRHETALWRAARYGRLQVVQLLCESGADLHIQDTGWGYTPLHAAVSEGRVLVVQYLIKHGAIVNTCDKFNNTSLLTAARSGHFEVFKLLSQYDKNVMVCNDDGDNILHCVVKSSNVELLRHILSTMTVNIDCCNRRHETALWLGVTSGQYQTVKLLCEYGANLNVPDAKCGWTPLHVAASRDHLQILQCLIQHGASLMSCDNE